MRQPFMIIDPRMVGFTPFTAVIMNTASMNLPVVPRPVGLGRVVGINWVWPVAGILSPGNYPAEINQR